MQLFDRVPTVLVDRNRVIGVSMDLSKAFDARFNPFTKSNGHTKNMRAREKLKEKEHEMILYHI